VNVGIPRTRDSSSDSVDDTEEFACHMGFLPCDTNGCTADLIGILSACAQPASLTAVQVAGRSREMANPLLADRRRLPLIKSRCNHNCNHHAKLWLCLITLLQKWLKLRSTLDTVSGVPSKQINSVRLQLTHKLLAIGEVKRGLRVPAICPPQDCPYFSLVCERNRRDRHCGRCQRLFRARRRSF
jgi:hypothetical protein